MGVGVQRHAPAALPPGKTQYPLYRRLGGPQERSGRVLKISPPPPGFDRRTVQPVATAPYSGEIKSNPPHVFIVCTGTLLLLQVVRWTPGSGVG
jgi:hypothetical protein